MTGRVAAAGCDVAVIGAGPYGLSIASHLKVRGVDHRVFGTPMHAWRAQMPQGMFLKSEGFASDLFEPRGGFRLAEYCASRGLPYADLGLPISREVFADYGVAFQRRFVPHLETTDVTEVRETPGGFRLALATGEMLRARRVVLAVGISHFAHVPEPLAGLPRTLVSHSSHHTDLSMFGGREVLVLGAGASALDCAALLTKAGASVGLAARVMSIHFHNGPGRLPRPLKDRLVSPASGLGRGWKSWFCSDLPSLFHAMPERTRLRIVREHLGPAPGWWTREMVEGKVTFHLGQTLQSASVRGGRIHLDLAGPGGDRTTLSPSHVIAATGYHADVRRLTFLNSALRERVRTVGDSPILSGDFESSVPGLYFVGPAAANSFGPVARFAFGARFTAARLARSLHRSRGGSDVFDHDQEARPFPQAEAA